MEIFRLTDLDLDRDKCYNVDYILLFSDNWGLKLKCVVKTFNSIKHSENIDECNNGGRAYYDVYGPRS